MELPVRDSDPSTKRDTLVARHMAIAVQANLAQLKVAGAKRHQVDPADHALGIVSPGRVTHFRETLIDRLAIKAYSEVELQLRLHEIWGRYCLMCWLFFQEGGEPFVNFATLSEDVEMRCGAALSAKLAEVHAILWRLRFEERHRMGHDAGQRREDDRDELLAKKIPAKVFGEGVEVASDEAILRAACEHAGMLAVLRWIVEPDAAWDDPRLMVVDVDPFAFA